ncbi:MAG: butyryl-CoA:acetate CoA-transferase [Firmicutes bacterium]|nr:butyryl-CoA:acetate CoA-transferase [Bacillota bacterium]
MDFIKEYKKKLRTPEEAVQVIKSGDWVDYTTNVSFPYLLDDALAKRKDELSDVKIRGNLIFGPIKTVEADPEREHFIYNSWHCSSYERALGDKGLCNYIPMVFRDCTEYYRVFLTVNVAMMAVPPMDDHGYFNLSCATGIAKGILDKADIVILEINDNLPYIYGAFDESIHISEVDYIVEGEHPELMQIPIGEASENDNAIASFILPHIQDGSALQLGIGTMPNIIGKAIAESDVKDLSMHTELCSDAYYELYRAGKITNRRKRLFPGKGLTGLVLGSDRLYKWVNRNPEVMIAPLSYVNAPEHIAQFDNMVSINNCISVDLYGQINAESVGFRQISGTGGQLDYLTGASMARGGKAFICLDSTFTDKDGTMHSNIKPYFHGDIVTDPRSQAYFIVTEYGGVNLTGRSTWERAEMLISIAHPNFRDDLIAAAENQKIWRKSNKK